MGLFGLLSNLDDKKWSERGSDEDKKATKDKKKMDGGVYAPYGVINITSHNDHMKFFLSSERGDPRTGYLFGANSNPMRDVGHAWFAFDKGDVIVGMAIEEDWVTLNKETLETIEPPKEDKKPELLRAETIDMGIYGDVVHSEWDSKGKPPRGKSQLGYHKFDIVRAEKGGLDSEFTVLVCSDPQGEQSKAKIKQCKINPFRQITKCFMKIVEENGEKVIKGVMVEDDWIEMYK